MKNIKNILICGKDYARKEKSFKGFSLFRKRKFVLRGGFGFRHGTGMRCLLQGRTAVYLMINWTSADTGSD